jgi:DNA-binding response OmpR family regulator
LRDYIDEQITTAPMNGPTSHPFPGVVRVLAVFDAAEDRQALSQLFRDFQWQARFTRSPSSLAGALQDFQPDVVMTDAVLPESQSWKDVLRSVQQGSELPVIVSSRLADETLWAEVLNLGGYDLLVKPFDAAEVQNVVSMACRAPYRPLVKRAG